MARILVADDSRAIRQLTTQALEAAGHEVLTAENGESGVAVARQQSLDLVLTDFNMPIMNGVELTRQIRSLALHQKTPILLVTTESQLAKKEQAKSAGATGWVVKPIPPQRLLDVVSKVLARTAVV